MNEFKVITKQHFSAPCGLSGRRAKENHKSEFVNLLSSFSGMRHQKNVEIYMERKEMTYGFSLQNNRSQVV